MDEYKFQASDFDFKHSSSTQRQSNYSIATRMAFFANKKTKELQDKIKELEKQIRELKKNEPT